MSPAQTLSKLRKLLGKNATYQIDERAPNAEQRAEAKAFLISSAETRNAAKERLAARFDELLRDPQYRKFLAECQAANKAHNVALSRANRYRISVGINNGLYFSAKVCGDTWNEIFSMLTRVGHEALRSEYPQAGDKP